MAAAALPLEEKPLSQIERVVDTFVAPSKTFADLLRSAAWWLPCVLVVCSAATYGYTAVTKVGLPTMTDNMIHSMPALEDRMQGDKTQAATVHDAIQRQLRAGFYSTPVSMVVGGFAIAGMFLATTNFGFGGRASYMQMLGVFWYSLLPLVVWYLLIAGLLFAGVNLDTFQAANPVGTNLGYYLQDSAPLLRSILASLDIFSIWIFCLQAIGMSRVGRISLGKGFASAAIWWLLYSGIFKVLPVVLFS